VLCRNCLGKVVNIVGNFFNLIGRIYNINWIFLTLVFDLDLFFTLFLRDIRIILFHLFCLILFTFQYCFCPNKNWYCCFQYCCNLKVESNYYHFYITPVNMIVHIGWHTVCVSWIMFNKVKWLFSNHFLLQLDQ